MADGMRLIVVMIYLRAFWAKVAPLADHVTWLRLVARPAQRSGAAAQFCAFSRAQRRNALLLWRHIFASDSIAAFVALQIYSTHMCLCLDIWRLSRHLIPVCSVILEFY